MNDRELLFVYGTLIESDIQKMVFGRVIKGKPDRLTGYLKKEKQFTDGTFPVVVSDAAGIVYGNVLELTSVELSRCDEYEGSAYCRFRVTLGSGKQVWIYSAF